MADDGRGPFNLKDPEAVIKASLRQKVEMVVDRDHELVHAEGTGRHIMAAGWINELEAREDGIWAKVQWTSSAIAQIKQREYRYISPVFGHKNGEVTRIRHVSLVNEPALELTAVASKTNSNQKEQFMKNKHLIALAALLSLPEGITGEEVVKAVEDQQKEFEKLENEVSAARKALNIAPEQDLAKAIETASKQTENGKNPDPEKFVPMSMFTETRDELSTLRETIAKDKADNAVVAAMAKGQISPAQKGWALEYASSNPTGFENFLKGQPVIVKDGEGELAGKKADKSDELTESQQAICNQLGLSKDQFLGKTKTEGDE